MITTQEAVQHYKDKTGSTNQQIADLLGVSVKSIEKWMQGTRKPKPLTEKMIIQILKED